jgi:CBS domain-containing protein
MKIADILRYKGANVVTTTPEADVAELLSMLAEHNVGALVVMREGHVVGIVSERDVVRRLNEQGAAVLKATVADIMTASVISCASEDSLDQVAAAMTELRIRHMPVIDGDRLGGIVTIGDVVLNRTRQLEQDRDRLEQYITG